MRTREIHVITERWYFYCLDCLQPYETTYEAQHADDGHGGDAVAWRRDGMAIQPPWIDPTCPGCRGLHVKVLPHGRSHVPRQR
ncbi:hypothetical protein [Spirillospora sp. NPDC047279]|uniref:hypothetical protein n=1 Tax=Spirillospora sp. NPDC047279 TaxID=3155478 RepID=UPI0033C4D7D7